MQILFNQTGLIDFSESTKQLLAKALPFAHFTYAPNKNYDAEIMIGYPALIKKEDILNYPKLKVIQLLSSGYDEIDTELLKSRNIRLFNAKTTNSTAISEFVIGQIINMNYNLALYGQLQEQKIWKRHYSSIELKGSRALILGAGAIGQNIAKRLRGFDVYLTGYRRRNVKTPYFNSLLTDVRDVIDKLPQFDYIISSLPLSNETFKLISYDWFKRMKPSALFINVARGEIVDEDDLNKALEEKLIRGAIIDVTTKEPLPIESPLWDRENLLLTPHVAFYNDKYFTNVINLLISNIDAYKNNNKIETEVIL